MVAIAWSPNNLKLAVASTDRSIYLFDDKGAKKDRFSTKPVDSKVAYESPNAFQSFFIRYGMTCTYYKKFCAYINFRTVKKVTW